MKLARSNRKYASRASALSRRGAARKKSARRRPWVGAEAPKVGAGPLLKSTWNRPMVGAVPPIEAARNRPEVVGKAGAKPPIGSAHSRSWRDAELPVSEEQPAGADPRTGVRDASYGVTAEPITRGAARVVCAEPLPRSARRRFWVGAGPTMGSARNCPWVRCGTARPWGEAWLPVGLPAPGESLVDAQTPNRR